MTIIMSRENIIVLDYIFPPLMHMHGIKWQWQFYVSKYFIQTQNFKAERRHVMQSIFNYDVIFL